MEKKQVFEELYKVDVNEHTEKKKVGNVELTYLSWAYAWAEVKKRYPDAQYEIERNADGLPYVFDPLTGYMVFTKMMIEGITHEMWLPVMDGANKAMKDRPYTYVTGYGQYKKEKTCEAATMFDVNKAIMRCLVKNIAMFGLGLYIFAGEDLPDSDKEQQPARKASAAEIKTARSIIEERGGDWKAFLGQWNVEEKDLTGERIGKMLVWLKDHPEAK